MCILLVLLSIGNPLVLCQDPVGRCICCGAKCQGLQMSGARGRSSDDHGIFGFVLGSDIIVHSNFRRIGSDQTITVQFPAITSPFAIRRHLFIGISFFETLALSSISVFQHPRFPSRAVLLR